ncbi:MAG: hypothetical protein WAZ60_23730 [Desulfosalsimonadaceae bacterium]
MISPAEIATIDRFAAAIAARALPGALETIKSQFSYSEYRDDPIGFCEDILHETLTDDVKKMMQSVQDYPITVAVSANATGKSHSGARIAVWFYKCHQDCKVFTAAAPPFENLKNILWGEIGSVVGKNAEMFSSDVVTSLDIRRGPEDFLTGVTIPSSGTAEEREAKFSGKHQAHMLFVLDEGDAIPDDVYKGIESCMSGGTKVRLLIFLNPRHAAGAVFRMQRDHTANVVHLSAFSHPNVIEGREVIPGAVTRETTVRRICEWTRPLNPEEKAEKETVFDLPEFLVGCVGKSMAGHEYQPLEPGTRKIINAAFSYMVLGRYPAQGANQLISTEWISRARARYDVYVAKHGDVPPVGASGIMGLDVAEMGDDLNIAMARHGGYVTTFKEWGGVDTIETGSRGVDWYYAHKGINRANVDATGVGAGVAPHMQLSGCVAVGIKVSERPTFKTEIGEFRILRDQLWWQCREWLRKDPGAMLPPDEELIEELQTPTYCTDSGKIEVMKKADMKEVLKRSPNKADALCLTFAGYGGLFDDCQFQDEAPE